MGNTVGKNASKKASQKVRRGGAAASPGTVAAAPSGPTVNGLAYGQSPHENAFLSRQAANQQQAALNKTSGGSKRLRKRGKKSKRGGTRHHYRGGAGVADNAAPTMEIYSPPVAYKESASGGASMDSINKNSQQSLVTAQTNAAYDSQVGGGRSGKRCQRGCGPRSLTRK